MDVSLPHVAPAPPRPRWRRAVNRLITWTLNTSLWFVAWFSMLVLVIVFEFGGEQWLGLPRSGPWALPGQLLMRALILVPFAVWLLLIIHPIRTRWWLARQAARLGRFIGRRPPPAPPAAVAARPRLIEPT
ncbi:MAG TPA: hypothetical protein VGE07_00660, partial [Herpetosiphonaceae bacterium]